LVQWAGAPPAVAAAAWRPALPCAALRSEKLLIFRLTVVAEEPVAATPLDVCFFSIGDLRGTSSFFCTVSLQKIS